MASAVTTSSPKYNLPLGRRLLLDQHHRGLPKTSETELDERVRKIVTGKISTIAASMDAYHDKNPDHGEACGLGLKGIKPPMYNETFESAKEK
ncbi:MAG: hypothetical protein K9M07_07275 [Simkaniaceae bacterium]|nr:hypothetical protein [Simkaniaceae bacterium]